jgi:serine/threonine protein kinase
MSNNSISKINIKQKINNASKKNIRETKRFTLKGGVDCKLLLNDVDCKAHKPKCLWSLSQRRCIDNPLNVPVIVEHPTENPLLRQAVLIPEKHKAIDLSTATIALASNTKLDPIIVPEIRILPENQDRSKKIHSIVCPELTVFSFENDFNIIVGDNQKGGYGEIIRATLKSTGQPVILKKFQQYSKDTAELPDDIIKEIAFIQLLNRYPQTKAVTLYGVALPSQLEEIYLVLESLEKCLNDIKMLDIPAEQIRIILYKIIKCFYYIHGLGIIHNDIKLKNLMIDKNDIRVIDFGITEFLSVGPSTDLVSDYICTETNKAPDTVDEKRCGYLETNRKSYASDMFSIGCTIIQLAIKNNFKIMQQQGQIYRVDLKGNKLENLTSMLISDEKFGAIGYDLLLRIMNNDTHLRLCTIDALVHPYFMGLSDDIPINRSIINGGNINKIYDMQIHYTEEEFNLNQMEICYLEIQHQTFIDDMIPLKSIQKNAQLKYIILLDWLLEVYLKKNIIHGFDTFANNLCILNNYFNEIYTKYGNSKLQMSGLLPNHISRSLYNYSVIDIETYCSLSANSFNKREAFEFILHDILIANNFKLPLYPISIHIQYVFLKLKYFLKEERIHSIEILKTLFRNICLHVLLWIMQPEPYEHPVTIWEIVIFSTNRSLALILDIPLFELNLHPLLNFITLNDNKYIEMNTYFNSALKNPLFLNKEIEILITTLNPIEKQLLF